MKEAVIMTDPIERDAVEGRYTQTQPEVAESRIVHGQYTEREGAGPEPDVAGTYVGAERDGSEPLVRSTHQRSGNYPKAEHESSHDVPRHGHKRSEQEEEPEEESDSM
jgi:hypothetical protein